jgi:hypothetical protein
MVSQRLMTVDIPMALFRALKLMERHHSVRQRKSSEMLTALKANLRMMIISTILTWFLNNIETYNSEHYSCPPYCGVAHEHIDGKAGNQGL